MSLANLKTKIYISFEGDVIMDKDDLFSEDELIDEIKKEFNDPNIKNLKINIENYSITEVK